MSRFPTYTGPGGQLTTSNVYVWDPNLLVSGVSTNQVIATGGMRPLYVTDFPGGGGAASSVVVTNSVTTSSGTYTPTFAIITGGQTTIPAGAKSASVAVISGSAYVNGTGPLIAGTSLNLGGYDGKMLLNGPVTVGGTGVVASPANILVSWEL